MSNFDIIQSDYSNGLSTLEIPEQVDLVFSDPPYNQGMKYADDPSGDRLSAGEYEEWLNIVMASLAGKMRPGATMWWVCPENYADLIGPMLTRIVGPRLYRIVWHETFSQYNRYDLTQDYRFIFCHVNNRLSQGDCVTKNLDEIRVPSTRMLMKDPRAAGPRIPGRVWKLRRLQGTAKCRVDWHPTQMPPEVLDRIIKGWTNPEDTVLDAFAGSGSMGVQCLEQGRNFIGIDRSPTYCARMKERLGEKSRE